MSGVQVAVRTRPTGTFAEDNLKIGADRQTIHVWPAAGAPHEHTREARQWKYDQVLHNVSQQTLFDELVAPVVDSVLAGYNGTVLCYGQTGAGKTYTHIGSTSSFAQRGIAPRAIARIFKHIDSHPHNEAVVTASYLEIHNDNLIDLLAHLPNEAQSSEPLTMIEDRNGALSVKGLRSLVVANEEAALAALFEGERSRSVSRHELNDHSSRAHAVFTLMLQVKSRVESSDRMTRAKLVLVDLAGSERLKKTNTAGDLKAESMYINKSLSFLEQVVVALASKSRTHTPYRQTKLTHLLKDALGGNSRTLLVAAIHCEKAHLEETIATLDFASRVRAVRNTATVNEATEPEMRLCNYKQQVSDLRRELAMHDSLANRSRISYDPFTDSERQHVTQQMEDFLEHRNDVELPIESVRHFQELLAAARRIYGEKASQLDALQQSIADGNVSHGSNGKLLGSVAANTTHGDENGVGEADASGISLGKAPDGARPAGGVCDPPSSGKGSTASATTSMGGRNALLSPTVGETMLGRGAAFEAFKLGEGQPTQQALLKAKAELKSLKLKQQELATAVNAAKADIDLYRAGADAKAAERASSVSVGGDGTIIIDEEEYALLQSMREAKQLYRQKHGELRDVALAVEAASATVVARRQDLIELFNMWYEESGHGHDDAPANSDSTSGNAGHKSDQWGSCGLNATTNEAKDEAELFELMQVSRALRHEPESLAFVRASKLTRSRRH